MLTMQQLLQSVRPGDWFTTVDLKDAYFHIPIKPAHRNYLRFAFQGTAYDFCVLPFGLSLAPRAFSKCMEAILAPLTLKGISAPLSGRPTHLFPVCSIGRGPNRTCHWPPSTPESYDELCEKPAHVFRQPPI
ncbi:UNVERIFIED_CONTAM: hypothetical protein FKN15_026584 [Acipenser sinensis]